MAFRPQMPCMRVPVPIWGCCRVWLVSRGHLSARAGVYERRVGAVGETGFGTSDSQLTIETLARTRGMLTAHKIKSAHMVNMNADREIHNDRLRYVTLGKTRLISHQTMY